MRNIIKKKTTVTSEVKVYNTIAKKEELLVLTDMENIPEGCVELSRTETSSVEQKFKMTPEVFFKHATVVED